MLMNNPISEEFRTALERLIHLDSVRSVSCDFDDIALWRALISEQVKRARLSNLPLQKAFCLCGPERGLPDVPYEEWGGEVHIPYEGVCDGDLLIYPGWRRFTPERLTGNGRLSYATGGKCCNYVLVRRDYGELPGTVRQNFGDWTLYTSTSPHRDCNPFHGDAR